MLMLDLDSKQKRPALHISERSIVPRTVIFIWGEKYSTGWGVDQKRGSKGQNIPNGSCFFAKCTCHGGFGEILFFALIFPFFGVRETFFVGCYVCQKLRYILHKLRYMQGPEGNCNGIIDFIYKIPLFLTLLSFICSSAPEQCAMVLVTFSKIVVCNGAQWAGPRG